MTHGVLFSFRLSADVTTVRFDLICLYLMTVAMLVALNASCRPIGLPSSTSASLLIIRKFRVTSRIILKGRVAELKMLLPSSSNQHVGSTGVDLS